MIVKDLSEHELTPQGPAAEISETECWALLEQQSFGHLGLSTAGRPEIFPVDYQVDQRTIVFRTAHGTKLTELISNPHAVFEVDNRSELGSWSVVVTGSAGLIIDSVEREAVQLLDFPDWVPTEVSLYVRIVPSAIRGRRFPLHDRVARR